MSEVLSEQHLPSNVPRAAMRSGITLVHVLAADPLEDGTARARSTIRTGSVQPGDQLWFVGAGSRRTATVVSVESTPRWTNIVLSGAREDLSCIVTGTYLRR